MDAVSPARLHKIRATRESIGKVVNMLSGRKIEVRQQGSQAYVQADPKTGLPKLVNIPVLPDNATDKLIDLIQGFIDHEVGHVLFTDHLVIGKADKLGKLHKALWNTVEDTFVERRMTKEFQGSRFNLANVRTVFLAKLAETALKNLDANPASTAQDYWNVLGVAAIRAWAGQTEMQDFMHSKWGHISAASEALKDLIPEILKVKSSSESLELSIKIYDALYTAPDSAEPGEPGKGTKGSEKSEKPKKSKKSEKEEPEEEDDDSESVDGSGAKPSEEEEEESDAEPEGEKNDGEESEGSEESTSDDDAEGDSEAGDMEGGASDSSAEDDSSDAESGDTEGETGKDKKTEGGQIEDVNSGPVFEAREEDAEVQPNFDETVGEVVAQQFQDDLTPGGYLPFSTAYDKVEPVKLTGHERRMLESEARSCEAKVSAITGMIQKDLERAFVAMNRKHWDSGRRSGRLNPANLARLAVNDDRIFRRRRETKTKDVAVTLLVDCSGSMAGGRIALATASAWAVAEVLDRINIPCEVLGFTTSHDTGAMEDQWRSDPNPHIYSRIYPLYVPIFKDFSEKFGPEQKLRLAKYYACVGHMSQNVDGECLQIAADRLARRQEPGKVIIVLSDGQPNAGYYGNASLDDHLRWTAEGLERVGIHCVGIGIQTDAPSHYYQHHVRVDELDQLGAAVLGQVRKVVLAA